MTKFKIGVVMTIVVALIFVFLGGSIFSIIIPTDWLFLIIYALALTVLILIFRKVEKPAFYIGIAVLVCVMTLASLIGYRAWNREDFYIDADEVKSIYYATDEYIEPYIKSDEEDIKEIVKKINKAYCVKKWDVENLGELGSSNENLYVNFKNGESVSIDSMGCVRFPGRNSLVIYRINLRPEDFFD